MNRELLTKAEELNDKYVQMWADICSIESPTDFKQGVDEVGRYFIEKAEAQGCRNSRRKDIGQLYKYYDEQYFG